MFLIALDSDFQALGEIDAFSSLQWFRRYGAAGEMILYCDLQYLDVTRQGAYIYKKDGAELALIESLETDESELCVRGRLAEGLMAPRVVDPVVTAADENVETLARRIVSANCVDQPGNFAGSGKIPDRAVSNLALGDLFGIGDTVSIENTNGTVLDVLLKLLAPFELGLRVRYDFETDNLYFEVYKGLDRTEEQSENNPAIFSDNFENVLSSVYKRDTASWRNYAICIGKDGLRTYVDQTNGEPRRELMVKDERFTDMAALAAKGAEELKKYALKESLSGTVDGAKNLIYKEDFDLGDLVTFKDTKIGISATARITEIAEIYEGGEPRLQVTFGQDGMTVADVLNSGKV
jgi:hypothetical protein